MDVLRCFCTRSFNQTDVNQDSYCFPKAKKRYSLLIRGTTNYVSSKHNVASLRDRFSMSQMRVDYWMEIDVFE